MALTEPHAGSDLRSIRTRAEQDGDQYAITGEKLWITNGLRVGLVVLLVRTGGGINVLLVEKEPGQAELPRLCSR